MTPPKLTPEQRSQRARIAALELHSRVDGREHTAPAFNASPAGLDYWERKVDPDGVLDPAEREKRADCAKRAHFTRLAFKSSRARTAKARRRKESP